MSDELGELLATHRYSTASEQWNLIPAGGLTGAATALLIAGVRTGTFLLVAGLLWLTVTIARILMLRARYGGGVIERREHGLVVSLRGGAPRAIPFEGIETFYESRSRWELISRLFLPNAAGLGALLADRSPKDVWEYRIQSGELALDLDRHWGDVRTLVVQIKKSRRAAVLPACKRKISRGETIAFGPVQLSPSELRIGPRTLAWNEVADIAVAQGELVVRRKPAGRFAGLDTRHVPDTDVVIELSRSLIANRPDAYR